MVVQAEKVNADVNREDVESLVRKQVSIQVPVPKHTGCQVCNEVFSDFHLHIQTSSHRAKLERERDYHSMIDLIISDLDSQIIKETHL
jgi:hypothetical protein